METNPEPSNNISQQPPATYLNAVLNAVDDGVLMVDTSGDVLFANIPLETLFGIQRREIVGKNLAQFPEDTLRALGITSQQAAEFARLPHRIAQQYASPYRYQIEEDFFERYAAPVGGEDGFPLGWVLVFRNVTDERYLAQTREQLTETLVHDMRSPLGAVKTSLELLEESLNEVEHNQIIDQALGIALRAIGRVLTLVDSLMDIRHLDAGQVRIKKAPLNLSALVAGLVEEIIPQSLEDQVFLTYDLPANLPMVEADQGVVQRVLVNLLDNALKFTPEGGRVLVQAEATGESSVRISVTDTGPGIPKRFREEVFSRFVQVPEARSKRRGAGLGLAYCRAAIEAHGENIWIEEGDQGVGTRVIFTLALA